MLVLVQTRSAAALSCVPQECVKQLQTVLVRSPQSVDRAHWWEPMTSVVRFSPVY